MKRIILFVFIVSAFSCNKFLDEKNDKTFLIPNTIKDLHLLIANNSVFNVGTTPELVESNDDVRYDSVAFFATALEGSPKSFIYRWDMKNYPEYKFGSGDGWGKPYQAIYYANICLDKVNKIEKTPANKRDWNKIAGASHFFRAYHMANLCWAYAKNYDEGNDKDPGIVIKLQNDFTVKSVRSSVKESYQQVLKDAWAALHLLEPGSENQFIPNKKAVCGLLARVYLSMLKYDSAGYYANQFLQYQNVLLDFNNPAEVDPASDFPIPEYSNEVAFLSSRVENGQGMEQIAADSSLYNLYEDHDLRKQAYFRDYYNRDGGIFPGLSNTVWMQRSTFTGINTSEMLITRAECYARAGVIDKALEDLNRLRAHRIETASFIPITENNQPQLLQRILEERRRELPGRGLRWMDIKRLNKEFNNIYVRHYDYEQGRYHVLVPNDDRFAIPIPIDIILLTGMPQN